MKIKFEDHLGLVYDRIKALGGSRYNQDLVQEGMIGLLLAVKHYKSDKAKFAYYARIWIDSKLKRRFFYEKFFLKMDFERYTRNKKAIERKREGATDEQLQKEFKIKKVKQLEETYDCTAISSTRRVFIAEDEKNPIWTGDYNDCLLVENNDDQNILKEELQNKINELPPNLKQIILNRFGINKDEKIMTLKEMAKELGVSTDKVREMEIEALVLLRNKVN